MTVSYWAGVALVGVLVTLMVGHAQIIWVRHKREVKLYAQRSMSELFFFVSLRGLLLGWGLLVFGVFITTLILTRSAPFVLLITTSAIAVPFYGIRRAKRRRACLFRQQLPDAVLLLSTSLRSGSSLTNAFSLLATETSAPLAQEFALVNRSLRLGEPMQEGLSRLLKRLPSEDLERLVIALLLAAEAGGQQADLLEEMSGSMRQKQQLQRRIEALTAQGRMQGLVMTMLPLLLALALWFIEEPTMTLLAQSPVGWAAAALILILLGLGYWVIQKIVHIRIPV